METMNIEIRNPKVKQLLKDLENLDLISINSPAINKTMLTELLQAIEKPSPDITLDEIVAEVNKYRNEKHA